MVLALAICYPFLLGMAREPTVQVRLFLSVTFDAKTHHKIDPFDAIHGLDLPMAIFAINVFFNMALVIKKHMFSQVVGLAPRCWCLCVEVTMLL